MELDNPNFSTCPRHPSQILTGVCSSCVAERLAGVDSIAVAVSSRESEIEEVEPVTGGGQSSRRVRRTLLSLFQLDDDRSSNQDVAEKLDDGGGGGGGGCEMMADRGGGFRLGSVISSRWKVRRSASQRVGGGQSEGKQSSGHTWEVPRHSWDGGSVVSKAFTCSFACLEEQQDPSRRGVEPVASVIDKGVDAREIDSEEYGVQADVNRRKSRRWSRVWDWSVISPFRDLAKKRGHVLDRSLSESWREGGRSKPVESTEPNHRIRLSANGHNSARPSQRLNRSGNAVNGDFSLDQQKKKEYRFGRSRSVHYSSPGNFDNGLLRFYLTPLRSSRRNAAKGRRRSSHSFARETIQDKGNTFHQNRARCGDEYYIMCQKGLLLCVSETIQEPYRTREILFTKRYILTYLKGISLRVRNHTGQGKYFSPESCEELTCDIASTSEAGKSGQTTCISVR